MTLSDRDEMAELALKRVRESGAEYGDIRLMQSMSQTISGEDRRIASVRDVALENGADIFLEKPFSLDEFTDAINSLLH